MKVKDFYLIEAIDITILDEPQRKFLDRQLNLFHETSSLNEKLTAIEKIIRNEKLKGIQFKYNEWLLKFITDQLKITSTAEESHHLLNMLGYCNQVFGMMYYNESKYDLALNSYKEAARVLKNQNNKELLFEVYNDISVVYYRKGEITNALETKEKATPLLSFIKKKKF